jgi:hypothetical protein
MATKPLYRFTVRGGVVQARIGGDRLDIPLADLPQLKQLHAQLREQGFEPVELGWIIGELTTPTPVNELVRQTVADEIPLERVRLINKIHKHWVDLLAESNRARAGAAAMARNFRL